MYRCRKGSLLRIKTGVIICLRNRACRQRLQPSPQEVRNGTFENNLPSQWLPNHPDYQQDTPETEIEPNHNKQRH